MQYRFAIGRVADKMAQIIIWRQRMRSFLKCSLVIGIIFFLAYCKAPFEKRFVSVSEGLPNGEQWKCNPALGDVNGDGFPDLAAIPRKGKGARVWLGSEEGAWSEASDGLHLDSSCGGGVVFGDIDNDGRLEMAVADHCKGVFVYGRDDSGKWTVISKGLPETGADDAAFGDFNKDGNLDLAVCSATDQGIRIFLGNGKGEWTEAAETGLPSTDDCHELALGDFNNDGFLDLAAVMVDKIGVWLNSSEGKWKESSGGLPELSYGGQYWGVATGDVNGDGHLDLAFARTVKGPEVYLGDGKGTWREASEGLSIVQSAWGVAFGDVDGDGHLDLLVSGNKDVKALGNAYGVFLFQGDGKGMWRYIEDSGLPEEGLFQSWGLALANTSAGGGLRVAGCFGIGISMEPVTFAKGANSPEKVPDGRDFGPGGSINVWKLQ